MEGSEAEEGLSFNIKCGHYNTIKSMRKTTGKTNHLSECSQSKCCEFFGKSFFLIGSKTGSTKKLKEEYKYTGKNITSKIKYNTDKKDPQGIVFTA